MATGGGFVIYTLNGHCRVLGVVIDGNIIYIQSTSNKMFKIDYKTSEEIARTNLTESGSSPIAPSVSSDGTVAYVETFSTGTPNYYKKPF